MDGFKPSKKQRTEGEEQHLSTHRILGSMLEALLMPMTLPGPLSNYRLQPEYQARCRERGRESKGSDCGPFSDGDTNDVLC